MENKIITNFLSNVLKREWYDEEERIGYTQELIIEVNEPLKKHAESVKNAWDEDEMIYKMMNEYLDEEKWETIDGKNIFFLNVIKIDEKKRKRGYGSEILKKIEKEAYDKNADEIHLVVQNVDSELKTYEEEKEGKQKVIKWLEKKGYKKWIEKEEVYMVKEI